MSKPIAVSGEEVARWLDDYKAAWENRDPRAAAALFAKDAGYFETPFSPPFLGEAGVRAYWKVVTESQRDIRFMYRVIAVTGCSALVHWNAAFLRSGKTVELDGMFLLEFDAAGLCTVLREWWHRKEAATA